MKVLIGLGIIGLGIALGLYVGVWLMFVLGIAQMINSLIAHPVNALGFAFGLAKFLFAAPVGWTIFILCSLIGGFITEY